MAIIDGQYHDFDEMTARQIVYLLEIISLERHGLSSIVLTNAEVASFTAYARRGPDARSFDDVLRRAEKMSGA